MRVLDISFPKPQENLAFDEVLLNGLEHKKSDETLRFWESSRRFVVLGVGPVHLINLSQCFEVKT